MANSKSENLPMRVRTNRVAIVGNQQPAIGALAGKDVEMVGPEINHHFLQLPLAVNRAQNSRRLQLSGHSLRQLQTILPVVFAQCLTIFLVVTRIAAIAWFVWIRTVLRRGWRAGISIASPAFGCDG